MNFQDKFSTLKDKKIAGVSIIYLAIFVIVLSVCFSAGGYFLSKKSNGGHKTPINTVMDMINNTLPSKKNSIKSSNEQTLFSEENEVIEGLTSKQKKPVVEKLMEDMKVY